MNEKRNRLVLVNGKVHTMNPVQPSAEAIAISAGRIAGVGTNAEILDWAKGACPKMDLGGKAVLPGFTDAHIHFLGYALGLERVDLDGTRSLKDALKIVKEAAGDIPRGRWITGRGWNYNYWEERRFPRREDLDRVCPDHPVALRSKDGHLLWVNTPAMKEAGVGRDTPDPPGGQIDRESDTKEPTGLFRERATGLIRPLIPEPTPSDRRRVLTRAMRIANRTGLTSIHNLEGRDALTEFQRFQASGELTLRVCTSIPWDNLAPARALGIRTGFGDEYIRIGPVKLFADGALGGQTAAMLEPYETAPEDTGIEVTSKEELVEQVRSSEDAGFDVAVHAIGDRAVRNTLDAIQESHEAGDRAGRRPRIEHLQVFHPDDLPRLRGLNVIASMQPIHATSDMGMADRHWGNRCRWAYAWRDVLSSGARLAFGSDGPVEPLDPLRGLYAATTRKWEDGIPEGGWYPEQCLSVEEAVYAYTMGAAYASGEENLKGSIEVGKVADLVVLSRDVFSIPPEEILQTRVEVTLFDGRVVWSAEEEEQ